MPDLIDALCDRLDAGLRGRTIAGIELEAVLAYRIEKEHANSDGGQVIVVAPAGMGEGWHHDGSHPYASSGIAVLVYPRRKDRRAGRFEAASRWSDEAHTVLQQDPMPFVWPESDPNVHVLSIRMMSGPEPVVVEGTDWPAMSRTYNVNANTQEAYK